MRGAAEVAVVGDVRATPLRLRRWLVMLWRATPLRLRRWLAMSVKADRAPAGPHDDDTVVMPAVLAGFSGRVQPGPQLPEQQVVRPALVETPTEKRRYRSLALAAAALAAAAYRRGVLRCE